MLRRFKVIALSVGGKNNKIFNSKDEVNENQFSSNVDELVRKGFLEEIEPLIVETDDVKTDDVKTDDVETDETSILDELTSQNDEESKLDVDDFSKKNIEAALKELNIEYKSRESKTVLWNLLMENESAVAVLTSNDI